MKIVKICGVLLLVGTIGLAVLFVVGVALVGGY